MEKKELIVALRHPEVKKEIARQVTEVLSYRDKKENANSKQASKREKRG
jgi:hypothetical protein